MDNKEFAKSLEERTLLFGVEIIKFSSKLPNTNEGKVLRNQISKSGTSIGANYREANRARSKADFANKIRISESEASETRYWIELIKRLEWVSDEIVNPICSESKELLAIFSKISGSLK